MFTLDELRTLRNLVEERVQIWDNMKHGLEFWAGNCEEARTLLTTIEEEICYMESVDA